MSFLSLPLRRSAALLLALVCFSPASGASMPPATPAPAPDAAVVLAAPDDPYFQLAEEIARAETLTVAYTAEDALEASAVFVLWVASPSHLSDSVMIRFGQLLRAQRSAVSVGIITGTTLDDARDLWLRAPEAKGERILAITAANPAAHIDAGITDLSGDEPVYWPLTMSGLVDALQGADYLTFAGHGGSSFLGIERGSSLRSADIAPLSPIVIATSSCNTLRPWEDGSIALALVDAGAAAYAGFTYSPTGGYLIGAYQGVPLRYTWPAVPIGHVVQVQNRGTLRGFAHLPYYWMLGDPRISLQDEPPYRLAEDLVEGSTRTITLSDAPAGFIPAIIPGGAGTTLSRYQTRARHGTATSSTAPVCRPWTWGRTSWWCSHMTAVMSP